MSKKPTITIRYPEASEKALKLTEAMVKRSPGKRVVETESEDPIFPDGGNLFSSFIRCKTQTGVDLTLTLNPASMDFALETLIRPNLNADERKQILGEDTASSEEALPGFAPAEDQQNGAQAAQAPGQALDGGSSPDVPSAEQEAATQSGEQETPAFSYQTYAEIGLILATLEFVPRNKKTASTINFLKDLAEITKKHLKRNIDECEGDFYEAKELADAMLHDTQPAAADPEKMLTELTGKIYNQDHGIETKEPSAPAEKSAAPLADGEIEPGLLNDLDEDKSSTAAVRSAPLADKEDAQS